VVERDGGGVLIYINNANYVNSIRQATPCGRRCPAQFWSLVSNGPAPHPSGPWTRKEIGNMLLKTGLKPILGLSALLLASTAAAQEAVTPTVNAEALFKSANPALNRNLQATYHIMKDLLEAGHWEKAPAYLTPRYIQHNPNVGSGRDTVVNFFASIGAKPKPIPPRLSAPVVQVLAQGDLSPVSAFGTD